MVMAPSPAFRRNILRYTLTACVALVTACATHTNTPEALLHRIYTLPIPYFEAFSNPKIRPQFYSARLHRLALNMEKCYAQTYGQEMLDFDFIVPGNDFGDIKRFDIQPVHVLPKKAQLKVMYEDFTGAVRIDYFLIRTPHGWRIDDVVDGEGKGTRLSDSLLLPC